MARPGARVRLLPPAVFLVPLAAALALPVVPNPWRVSGPAPAVVGASLGLAGAALFLWAGWTLLRRGTTVVPWHEVDTLVTTGPFARTRNPIYLGDALIYLGATIGFQSPTALVVLPVVIAVMQRFVIRREEAYLTSRFGTAYTWYAARVRRWI